jgi:hypothetical protein
MCSVSVSGSRVSPCIDQYAGLAWSSMYDDLNMAHEIIWGYFMYSSWWYFLSGPVGFFHPSQQDPPASGGSEGAPAYPAAESLCGGSAG